MIFKCSCGQQEFEVTREQIRYQCSECYTAYRILAVPFDVFTVSEKRLIRMKDSRMKAICSEVAAKRLMAYQYPDLAKFPLTVLQERGCYDIHTIPKCLTMLLKLQAEEQEVYNPRKGYALLYQMPFQIQQQNESIRLMKYYIARYQEPLIVSVMTDKKKIEFEERIKMGDDYTTVLKETLHTVILVGFSTPSSISKEPPKFLLHNHRAEIPLEQQTPFEQLSVEKFQKIHLFADYRVIMNWFLIKNNQEFASKIKQYYMFWEQ
jgi:hypothetical protein